MRALILAIPLLCACPSLGSETFQQLDEMEQVEYDRFLRRVDSWTWVATWALLEEDVIALGDLEAMAAVVQGAASGSVLGATGVIQDAFGRKGWESAALFLMASEADLLLERRGVWGSPRALEVLDTIAAAMRRAWAPPTVDAEVEHEVVAAEL